MIARLSMCHAFAAFVALVSIAVAKPAFAQVSAQPPSAAAILIAKHIVEIENVKDIRFEPLIRGVVQRVKNQFMQTNFMWAKDLNEVAINLEREYASRVSELVDFQARAYANHFTETELKEILNFLQSPTGRKFLVEEPKVVVEGMAYAGDFGDKLSDEVIAKMREEMRKRGHDI